MKFNRGLFIVFVGLLLGLGAVEISRAQEPILPGDLQDVTTPAGMTADTDAISIQGRLTDSSGAPLHGLYDIVFRLYTDSIGSIPICENLKSVNVSHGLFSERIYDCKSHIQYVEYPVYLGISVGGDPEMMPRTPIDPVPAAWDLRSPSFIDGYDMDSYLLYVHNISTGGAIFAWCDYCTALFALGNSSYAPALKAYNSFGPGLKTSSQSGIGLVAESESGIAVHAAGTGRIKSEADTYLFISGNSLEKSTSTDTTIFMYDSYGGYKVYGGGDWANPKTVILPVSIVGVQYGQSYTLSQFDLFYQTSDATTFIGIFAMRRQNGVGNGDLILKDESDYICPMPTQCNKIWFLTQNNVLSLDHGILYIALQLNFSSADAWITIGGAQLHLVQE